MATETPRTKRGTKIRRTLLPVFLVLVGLSVMLYPVVSSTWNNFAQQRVASEYERIMGETDPEVLAEAVQNAHAYNREHTPGPILDPWDSRVSEENELYQLYLSQLSGQPAMSQVVIPAIDSQLPVYHGTQASTLERGLGHLYGSALPVGGPGTHSVITGHTGMTNATLWDNLIDVKKGDAIYVSTFGERMKYEVHDIDVVEPDETDSLAPIADQDLLTLITCTPYGVNTHRLLVHAHRVPMDPDEESVFEDTGFKLQWWMWALIIAAIIIVLLLAWWIWRMLRKDKNKKSQEEEAED